VKTLRQLLVILIVVSFVLPAFGDELRTAAPAKIGLSKERLDRIGPVMQRYVDTKQAAGVVVLIARHGRIGYLEAFGKQDAESGVPVKKDTIFRIYSMTKPLTSVAAMVLYEEGRFRLKDPVARYLPEFKDAQVAVEETNPQTGEKTFKTVPAQRPITVRDLLRHTSGLTYIPPKGSALVRLGAATI